MESDFRDALRKAKTMSDVFYVCETLYDLERPIGAAAKGAVIIGIKKAIKLINAKRR